MNINPLHILDSSLDEFHSIAESYQEANQQEAILLFSVADYIIQKMSPAETAEKLQNNWDWADDLKAIFTGKNKPSTQSHGGELMSEEDLIKLAKSGLSLTEYLKTTK